MAVVVKPAWLLLAVLVLTAQAHALGPQAPFTPPRAGLPAAAAASASADASAGNSASNTACDSCDTGLAGLRLAGTGSAALIDGRWWPLGSQPRGARLVSIQRHQVQLRHADGRLQVLSLNPDAALISRKVSP